MLNITLSVFLIIALFLIVQGYTGGLVTKLIDAVVLVILSTLFVIVSIFLNEHLSGTTMNIIVGAILFLGLVILHLVWNALVLNTKNVEKLGSKKLVLRILGAPIGVVEAVVILWAVYGIMGALNMGGVSDRVLMETTNTPILLWLYNHNLIDIIVKALPFV